MARCVLEGYLKPPSTNLFDNVTQKFGDSDWRIHKSWKLFKKELSKNIGSSMIDCYKITQEDTNKLQKGFDGNLPPIPIIDDTKVNLNLYYYYYYYYY
jgi:hypothetical protein